MKRFIVGLRNAECWQGKESCPTLFRTQAEAQRWLHEAQIQFPNSDLIIWEVELTPQRP